MVTDAEIQVKVWENQARELGKEAGAAAASWLEPGDKEAAARILWMIRGGDPAAVDYLPREPDLSGEMADAPTPRSITEEIAGDFAGLEPTHSDDQLAELMQTLSDAWEEGVSETFELECELAAMRIAEPERGNDLDAFHEGYMVCALWSSSDGEENPLDDKYSPEDIEISTRQEMRRECARFYRDNIESLERLSELTGRDMGSHGHDLWLTRNGHGAGYWDRYMEADLPHQGKAKEIGDLLTIEAQAMGEYHIYPNDGRIEQL